jgi:hypothetical protein
MTERLPPLDASYDYVDRGSILRHDLFLGCGVTADAPGIVQPGTKQDGEKALENRLASSMYSSRCLIRDIPPGASTQ